MLSLLPFILAFFSFIGWYGVAKVRKVTFKDLRNMAVSTLVILLFLAHPSIVQYMFNVFNCYPVDGDNRVLVDLQIVCY